MSNNLYISKIKHYYCIIKENNNYLVINNGNGELKGTHNKYKTAYMQKRLLEEWKK